MKIGTKVTLSEGEQEVCRLIAEMKYTANRKAGVMDNQKSSLDKIQMDRDGFAAEIAFCKIFNLYPDFNINIKSARKGTDPGDAVMPNGTTIDVKWTRHKNGKLAVFPWKKGSVDSYVLMIGEFPTFEFRGQIESRFLTRLGDLGTGQILIADQEELKEF